MQVYRKQDVIATEAAMELKDEKFLDPKRANF